jgi:hypothetical protein
MHGVLAFVGGLSWTCALVVNLGDAAILSPSA